MKDFNEEITHIMNEFDLLHVISDVSKLLMMDCLPPRTLHDVNDLRERPHLYFAVLLWYYHEVR